MKIALLVFSCDGANCLEESSPERNWAEARKTAREEGWWLGRDGMALCPVHTEDAVRRS